MTDPRTLELLADYRRRVLAVLTNRGVDPLRWLPSLLALEIQDLSLIGESVMPDLEQAKALAERHGIPVGAPGWLQKLIDLLASTLDLFRSDRPVMQARAGHEDLHAGSCEVVCKSGETLLAALRHHEQCCADQGHS